MYYIMKNHVPFTMPRIATKSLTEEDKKNNSDIKYYSPETELRLLLINDTPVIKVSEYLDCNVESKVVVSFEEYQDVVKAFKILSGKDDYPLTLKNFEYNGYMGKELPGFAPYRGQFDYWTKDPGIVKLKCSDGENRLFPTFAIDPSFISIALPQPDPRHTTVLFGAPAKS